jgi:hypothetical protein
MRLDFLILADRAEAIGGKLYMVGGAFDQVRVPDVPGSADFDVAIGFLVDYNETNEPHEFSLTIEDADNNVLLGPIGGRLEVGRPAGMKAGQVQRVVLVLRGPFPIPVTGDLRWVPLLDGTPAAPTRFRVEKLRACE